MKEECEERKSAEARVKESDAALADAIAATREAEARASLAAASATSEAMAARRVRPEAAAGASGVVHPTHPVALHARSTAIAPECNAQGVRIAC